MKNECSCIESTRNLMNFVLGLASMKTIKDVGLCEGDVRTPDHRKYLFHFHERIIEEARKVLKDLEQN